MGEPDETMRTPPIDRLREMKLSVSIPLIVVIVGATYSGGVHVSAWYEQYHRGLARAEATAIMLAKTENLEKNVEETQTAVAELKGQVSSLQVSAAIAAVAALQTELDRHERNPEESASWNKERDRLKRQIEQAKEYRQCLIDGGRNCELLRGW